MRLRHSYSKPQRDKLCQHGSEEEEPIFHKGREVGGKGTPNITTALGHLFDRLGNAHAIGIPSVFGFVETLYLRTEQGAAIYDISVPEQPQEIHALSSPGWYQDTTAADNIPWTATIPRAM